MLVQLRMMREREPSAKALVFSQFASTIEWLKVKLQEQGFGYHTISGSMTLKQRSKVCTHTLLPLHLLCMQASQYYLNPPLRSLSASLNCLRPPHLPPWTPSPHPLPALLGTVAGGGHQGVKPVLPQPIGHLAPMTVANMV